MLLDWLNMTMHRELVRLASIDRERERERERETEREREREKEEKNREGTVQRSEAACSRDVFH
jgi:hypothetical protein